MKQKKKAKQKNGVKSTPHMKGTPRGSGKSFRYKIVLPDHLTRLTTGLYKIWVSVNETKNKKMMTFDIRELVADSDEL